MKVRSFLPQILMVVMMAGFGTAAVLLTARYLGPLPLSVSSTVSQKQSLFTASGESEISVVPDQAEISLGINVQKSTVIAAQEEVNKVSKSIIESLQQLGIKKEDIKTQNYSVYPDYDYSSDARKIVGYRVNSSLMVKIKDFEKLNQVIDVATSLGANQVGGINFSLSEDKEKELKKEARKEAISNAKESAQELANLSGVRLGKVVDVDESRGGDYPMPVYARSEMAYDSGLGGVEEKTQIEPGSTTYNYSVTLMYETL